MTFESLTCTSVTGLVDPSAITARCVFCGGAIEGKINRVDSKAACDSCLVASSKGFMEDRVLFTRGMILGSVAAFVYFLLLACIDVLLNGVKGPSFFALPVGWVVGRAFAMGSRGAPGFKFSLTAVLLSYFSMALASVPILFIHAIDKAADTGSWAGHLLAGLPLWAVASPFLVEEGRGAMGMLSLLFLAIGLVIAGREAGRAPRSPLTKSIQQNLWPRDV
jgi:hypothetical protein